MNKEYLFTTIKLSEWTKDCLDKIKVHPRETYDQVVRRLLEVFHRK